jgi:hypoxia up-regulated 1
MANLKVVQLINSNIAAGLNYGVFRRKDFNSTGSTFMFYDMGATGTIATVATFQMVKNKDDYEPNPQLVVRGVGFDRSLGGKDFTQRLANHLAKLFKEKTKKDVYQDSKALNKLFKEAERVKNVLSANTDHMAQVESLMDDVDFKAKVTREEFLSLCADLFDRVKKPVEDALEASEVLPTEILSVILVGGSTRIPKVQEELLKAAQKTELGKNLNTDEAIALGAVYQCAFQSKGYKVKKFGLKDMNPYQIVVDFERFVEEGEVLEAKLSSKIRRVLFDRLNPFPQKKVMTFSKHTKDFDFSVNYGDLSFYDAQTIKTMGSLNISQVSLKSVPETFGKHEGEESKGIKVHFKLDDSGILNLDKIDISFEKVNPAGVPDVTTDESTFSKIGSKISSFFGSGNAEANDDEKRDNRENSENEKETTSTAEPDAASSNNTTPSPEKTLNETASNVTDSKSLNKTATAKPVPLILTSSEFIKYETAQVDLLKLDTQAYDDSVAKLQFIKEKEREKRKRALAFNTLETFIFDTRDKLGQEEFVKLSKESEREAIQVKIDDVDSWLSEVDDAVETKAFQDKLAELRNVSRDVYFRLNEKKLRPKRLDEMKDVLNRSSSFLSTLSNYTGEDLPLTETDRSGLEKLVNTTKEWKVKMLNEQAKLAENEHPKLLSSDIADKIDALKREVNYLVSKIKYFKPKTTKRPPTIPKSKSNSTANNGNSTKVDEAEADSTSKNKKTESNEEENAEKKPAEKSIFEEEEIYTEEDGTDPKKTTEQPLTDNPEL